MKRLLSIPFLLLASLATFAQDAPPFHIREGLYDATRQETDLGLPAIDGAETVTVFAPTDSTDHFSNGETWTTSVLTDVPDSRSKQSAGNLPDGTCYFVSNPVTNKFRYPLVLTLSKDGTHFDTAYLLRTKQDISSIRYNGKAKRLGYSYPKSIVIGHYLYVSYSMNKEDVQFTRIPL